MRAVVFQEAGKPLTLTQVADPEPAGANVVLQVRHAGICGSDLHMAEYGYAGPGTVFGHEFSGTISALGQDAPAGLAVGDRVTANPFDACRTCEYCGDGHLSLCSHNSCIGVSPDRPGAYAEYLSVPAHRLLRLPTGASFEEGALVEPLAVAYHAVRLARLGGGERVLVMGAGPIGLAVTLLCRQAGVRNIAVSDPAKARRDRALDFGAAALIDPASGDLAQQANAALGGMPSVVIECVGNAGRIQDAINVIAPRGLIVVPGACMTQDNIFPALAMMKEVRIQFSATYTDSDFEAVIGLIARREIDAVSLCTRTVSLAEAPEAFASLAKDPTQIKVLIEPGRTGIQ